jgi:effector-binding domain-containing protein
VAVHHGTLAEVDQTYGALGIYVAECEIGADGPIREHYVVTPFDTDDESDLVTEVCWPVSPTAYVSRASQ